MMFQLTLIALHSSVLDHEGLDLSAGDRNEPSRVLPIIDKPQQGIESHHQISQSHSVA